MSIKKNVQIWKAEDIADFLRADDNTPALKDYRIDGNGHFITKTWNGEKQAFTDTLTLTAGDVAQMVDMPLWELVKVGWGGFEEFALLFYELD